MRYVRRLPFTGYKKNNYASGVTYTVNDESKLLLQTISKTEYVNDEWVSYANALGSSLGTWARAGSWESADSSNWLTDSAAATTVRLDVPSLCGGWRSCAVS